MTMMIRQAFGRGFRAWRAQGGLWLGSTVLMLCMLGMSLAPLLLLTAAEVRLGALLCVPLYLLCMLPLRQGMASLYVRAVKGERLELADLLPGAAFGPAMKRGLKAALCLLLWGAPALVATLWLFAQYKGAQDVFSLMRMAGSLGGGVAVDGVLTAVGLYLLMFLPLLAGLAFHSGGRYAAVCGQTVRGRRGGMMRCWLCSQVTLAPFLAVAVVLLAGAVPQVLAAVDAKSLALLPDFGQLSLYLAADAAVLLLPALPLRGLIQAAWVYGEEAA